MWTEQIFVGREAELKAILPHRAAKGRHARTVGSMRCRGELCGTVVVADSRYLGRLMEKKIKIIEETART